MTDADRLISLEEFRRDWLLPSQVGEIFEHYGVRLGKQSLVNRLALGLISAFAEEAIQTKRSLPPLAAGFSSVPMWAWGDNRSGPDADFWESGDLLRVFVSFDPDTAPRIAESASDRTSNYRISTEYEAWDFVGVRFDPGGIRSMLPTNKVFFVAPVEEPIRAPRGRPKSDFWEEMWADLAAQILSGELMPSKQVDIEKAIQDWAIENDKSVAEQTGRKRARMLWQAHQKRALNPADN